MTFEIRTGPFSEVRMALSPDIPEGYVIEWNPLDEWHFTGPSGASANFDTPEDALAYILVEQAGARYGHKSHWRPLAEVIMDNDIKRSALKKERLRKCISIIEREGIKK
jgi:hypothetical protein